MTDFVQDPFASAEDAGRVAALLGGRRILRRQVNNALDAHELILAGIPTNALLHLLARFPMLASTPALAAAVGVSVRTLQRRKGTPSKSLSKEQGGRTWKVAEILAKASEVFGTQSAAEQWLETPALGLDGRKPIDLLATTAGVEIVEDFLGRLAYGVYT